MRAPLFKSRMVAVVVITLSLPQTAAAAEPLKLEPSSNWYIHYAEDSCRMARTFGEGDQAVTLIADRFEPGDDLRLTFVGRPVHGDADGKIKLRFGPGETSEEIEYFAAKMRNEPAIVLRGSVRVVPLTTAKLKTQAAANKSNRFGVRFPDLTPAQEEAVTFLEVMRGVRQPFILETGSLGPPLKTLRACTDELLTHWGIDVSKHASLSRKAVPQGSPARWFSSDDYPSAMLDAGKRAMVQFRVNIDASGVPTACHIQQSTRPKEFDDAVCKAILRKARFDPALDIDGKPVASYWRNAVTFNM